MKNKIIKSIMIALIVVVNAACGGGGGGDACSTLRVAGGDSCTSSNNPAVLLKLDNNTKICSGTIITRTSVITAAHCVVGAKNMEVHHRNAVENVTEAFYNSRYPGGVHPYDLAIVKVSTNFTDAANFAPLPLQLSKDIPQGERVSIFGFGLDENGNVSINFPRAGFLKVLGVAYSMIIAEIDNSFGLPGDSGGPLVYDNALIGVFSGFRTSPPLNMFVNLRDPVNLAFINEIASDTAVRSKVLKNANSWNLK